MAASPLLTIGMAVYQQPIMLAEWFQRLDGYPLTDDVEVIVVDDCGLVPAVVPEWPNVRLLRVLEDIPWAQGQARNLAAQEATGRVLLMVDPDMTFPPGSLMAFVETAKKLKPKHVVRPVLRHGNGEIDSTSPNVYLIHREDFLASKGYDLSYLGKKGWSDVELSQVWARMFRTSTDRRLVLDFHHEGAFSDAQVKTLDRSVAHNKTVHVQRKERLRKLGLTKFLQEHSPMVRSSWERIR